MVAPAVMRLGDQDQLPQHGELTLIQPETDEVIRSASRYDWSDKLERPMSCLKVAECGHFFHGKLTISRILILPRLFELICSLTSDYP